jgi:hypothetical protein
MAGSIQSANAMADLKAVTKTADDPDFDQSMEVGERNTRGGDGSSDDGGHAPQSGQEQQAPPPRPMPALGGDPLKELRGGSGYAFAPPLPNQSFGAPKSQVDAPEGTAEQSGVNDQSSGSDQFASSNRTMAQAAPGGAGAQSTPAQGAYAQPVLPQNGSLAPVTPNRPANVPSVTVRAASNLGSMASNRALRRAERQAAASQHLLPPVALQSPNPHAKTGAAAQNADWNAIAKVNAPSMSPVSAAGRNGPVLKRKNWFAATSDQSAFGTHQNPDGSHPDPMVRFANEHDRKRKALDTLFDRFAHIDAASVSGAARPAPIRSMPVPQSARTVQKPQKSYF